MKDYILFAALPPIYHLAQTVDPNHFPLWERLLEKWGIGLIGMGLFGLLASWTYRREEKAQERREKKEDQAQSERVQLAKENNELSLRIIQQAAEHSSRLEELVRDSNEAEKQTHKHLEDLIIHLKTK